MTAFYMFRALGMTFFGKFRGTEEQNHHVHESPAAMTIPLIVLAILALVGGWIGIPELYGGHHELGAFLAPVFAQSQAIASQHALSHNTEWILIAVTTALVTIFAVWAWVKSARFQDTGKEESGLSKVLQNKWYVDELYAAIIRKPLRVISGWLNSDFEKLGVDGIVNGVGKTVLWGSRQFRRVQTGRVGFYIFGMVLGMIALLIIAFYI